MLRITLYKNCILNEKYNEVISLGKETGQTKSILEKYLETLNNETIEIPYVFFENDGQFVFERNIINNNIYEFNYMKILAFSDTSDELIWTRYCFIKKITIKHDCVYLDYNEDVWSSYSDKIKLITPSYLIRSRINNYNDFLINLKSIPIDYDGNNNLNIEFLTEETDVQVIVEIQTYELASQGNIKNARFSTFYQYLRNNSTTGIELQNDSQYMPYSVAINDIVYKLIPAVSLTKISYWNGTSASNHENFVIGNIYIVPKEFDLKTNLDITNMWKIDYVSRPNVGISGALTTIGRNFLKDIVYSGNIINDYKNIAVGLISNNIKLPNNGTDIPYTIEMVKDNFSIHFYFNILNQYIEITKEFLCEVPFSILTSEELAQQRMALVLKNQEMDFSKQILQYGIAADFVKTGLGAFNMAVGQGLERPSMMSKGAMEEVEGLQGIFTGIEKDLFIKEKKTLINKPIYSYNKGTFVNTSNKINSIKGICVFKINADNSNFVKNFINNFGYIVYEFINTEKFNKIDINGSDYFISNNINYNVIKFEYINLIGSFPKEIADKLEEILTNGVKIWYNENLEEDNYVI